MSAILIFGLGAVSAQALIPLSKLIRNPVKGEIRQLHSGSERMRAERNARLSKIALTTREINDLELNEPLL